MNRLHLLVLFILGLFSCNHEKIQFSRLSPSETGVDFVNVNVENEQINIFTYEYLYNGGGVSVGDVNNDGYSDIYFTSNNQSNRLYLNNGDFTFKDITEESGAGCVKGWKTGVTMVDINSDGFLDIYVCRSADSNPDRRRNSLLINNGNLTFTDRAKEYGLDDDSYTTQAAFFDYDKDGDLDVFLLNHSLLQISNSFNIGSINQQIRYPYVGNKLLRNEGGKFVDVSDLAGVFGPSSNYGLGIAITDLNNDSWPDVYFSNDYVDKDRALLNNQDGTFHDATDSLFTHLSQFSMGLDVADINNDGWFDVGTLDMLPEDNKRQKLLFAPDRYDVYKRSYMNGYYRQFMRNMLQLNNGNGSFSEIGQLAGISNTDWSWSLLFGDYDNDGLQDAFITNGYKRDFTNVDFLKYRADQEIKSRQGQGDSYLDMIKKIPQNKPINYIFKNNGNLTFDNVQSDWGFTEPSLSNGAAYSDLDNDGDLDLITNNIDEPASIFKNNSEKIGKGGFLKVKLKGLPGNLNGIGSKVTIWSGYEQQTRWQSLSRGFQSSVDPVLHFGIRKDLDRVDSVVVEWPSSKISKSFNVGINQVVDFSENEALVVLKKVPRKETPFFSKAKESIDYLHKESDFIDFKVQALLPKFYSRQGPTIAIGDIDRNNRDDVFVGGSLGQESKLYFLTENGTFQFREKSIKEMPQSELADSHFFDADNDGDLDLICVTGSYELNDGDESLSDYLFVNNGFGEFNLKKNALPNFKESGSCVSSEDVDSDGDLDLFVGGGVKSGQYPINTKSRLLINDGVGVFTDKTSDLALGLGDVGIVTDAVWVDVNGDNKRDLVIVGEWMPVSIFVNINGTLINRTREFIPTETKGWWNAVAGADVDNDGDTDLIVGNQGLNNQMGSISKERPVRLVYSDFDKNGSVDPILCYFIKGREFPYPNRDELTDQLPFLKRRFNDYESYSDVGLNQIFNKAELDQAKELSASNFHSVCLINNLNKGFVLKQLPIQAQFAPVNCIYIGHINDDAVVDLVLAGNNEGTRVRTGIYSGNNGSLFLGMGNGDFEYVNQIKSGLDIKGQVNSIKYSNGLFFFGVNNAKTEVYTRVLK